MPDGLIYRTATQSAEDPYEYILSEETIDRMGEVIVASGWDLSVAKNSVLTALFNHSTSAIVGRWENVRVRGKQLLARIVFATPGTSQLADDIRRHWEDGNLKAASVGFFATKKEPMNAEADEFWGPFRYLKQTLVEASLVVVPANPNAGPIKGRTISLPPTAQRQLFGKSATEMLISRALASRVPASSHEPKGTPMKTALSKQIETAQNDLNRLRDQLTALAEIEERDDEQENLFETLPGVIAEQVKNLAKLKAAEAALVTRTVDPDPANPNPDPARQQLTAVPQQRPFAIPKKKVEPADYVLRAIACGVKAFGTQVPIEQAMREMYGNDEATQIVLRAAVNPAQTTVAGWAAELVQTSNAGYLDRLLVDSLYGPLSTAGARYDLGRNGQLKIPTRSNTPRAAGAWVGEGAPKPVKRIGFGSVSLIPHKLAVITTFTEEMANYSVPAIEGLLRQAMADDTSEALDGYLIDAIAASAVRPAGLLNGVTPITASILTPATSAMVADLKALVGAIVTNGGGRNIIILMNPVQGMAIGFAQTTTGDFMFESTDQAGRKFMSRIITSRAVPAGQVIAIDAADFATATGDVPRFAVSNEATLHEEDTTPLALGTAGSPNTVAAPMRSLFQTDSVAIRLTLYVTWAMRRAGMVASITAVTW